MIWGVCYITIIQFGAKPPNQVKGILIRDKQQYYEHALGK